MNTRNHFCPGRWIALVVVCCYGLTVQAATLWWRHKDSGYNAVWVYHDRTTNQNLNTLISPELNLSWQIVGSGDFNRDGNPDILWHQTTNGLLTVWYMNNATKLGSANLSHAQPNLNFGVGTTGDFNKDGWVDIIWRNRFTGENLIWYLNGVTKVSESPIEQLGGINLDFEMVGAGDFNGDSNLDILWRPRTNWAA